MKPPLPGRHNHVDGTPPESFAYVAEMGQEPVGDPSKLGRAMAKPPPHKWYRVPVTALVYALNPDHAHAISLNLTKDLTLGGKAAWHIGDPTEAEDA